MSRRWSALLCVVIVAACEPYAVVVVEDPLSLADDAATIAFGEELEALTETQLEQALPASITLTSDEGGTRLIWAEARSADGATLGRGSADVPFERRNLPVTITLAPPCDGDDFAGADDVVDPRCEDGSFCNGREVCRGRVCVDGARPCQPSPFRCVEVSCLDTLARCSVVADHARCGDGELCRGDEGCVVGAACSLDSECGDDDACNGGEACVDGRCAADTPPALDDDNDCTLDGCDAEDGVLHAPLHAVTCDDGDGVCVLGFCVPETELVQCSESRECADELICNGVETCFNGLCLPGIPFDPDDGDPCTVDSCVEGAGVANPPGNEGASCDAAGAPGSCRAGACVPDGTDAGPLSDAGGSADAGGDGGVDAGDLDAGDLDAGPDAGDDAGGDAGMTGGGTDAGPPGDAGPSDAGASPVDSGTPDAGPALLAASSPSVIFTPTAATTSSSATLRISNAGSGTIAAVAEGDGLAEPFSWLAGSLAYALAGCLPLGPLATCDLTFIYAPSVVGHHTDTLTLTSAAGSVQIRLVGDTQFGGTLNSLFGAGGIALSGRVIGDVHVLAGVDVLLAGSEVAAPGGLEQALLRVDFLGAPVSGYGTSGVAVATIAGNDEDDYPLRIVPRGTNTLVAGWHDGAGASPVTSLFNPDGAQVTAYGTSGSRVPIIPAVSPVWTAAAGAALDSVFVAGTDDVAGRNDAVVLKIGSDGNLDSAWGAGGRVSFGDTGQDYRARAVLEAGIGGAWVAGDLRPEGGGASRPFLQRLDGVGDPVTGWPATARVFNEPGYSARALAPHATGVTVVFSSRNSTTLVFRAYDHDGAQTPLFAGGATRVAVVFDDSVTNHTLNGHEIEAMIVDDGLRLVAVGAKVVTGAFTQVASVYRLRPDGSADTNLDGDGDAHFDTPENRFTGVAQLSFGDYVLSSSNGVYRMTP
jgi:hypothetical protein